MPIRSRTGAQGTPAAAAAARRSAAASMSDSLAAMEFVDWLMTTTVTALEPAHQPFVSLSDTLE